MTEVERAAEQLGISDWNFEPVQESFTSQVRLVSKGTERAVLKVFWNTSKLAREHAALGALRGFTKVPSVLATCEDPPAMLMTRLDGEPVRVVTNRLAREIGECLAQIQTPSVTVSGDWWVAFQNFVTNQLALSRGINEIDWGLVETTFARLMLDRAPVEQRLVHFDFRLGNMLTDGTSLTGLVDFESARPGAVDFDFTKASLEIWPLHRDFEGAMLDGYSSVRPVPSQLYENLALYRLYLPMSGLGWCAKRGLRNEFFAENVRQLRDALMNLG